MRRTFSRIGSLFWRYKELSVAVVSVVVAAGLELSRKHVAAHWVLGTVSILVLVPLANTMWDSFRHGLWKINLLGLVAVVAAVLLHQYWAAVVVVIVLTAEELLDAYATYKSQTELRSLLEHTPKVARLFKSGKTTDITASEVNVGDKLVIEPGELVPVDAVILEGQSSFDESRLTGENQPQSYQIGETIISGSLNLDETVTVKALHSAANSQYEQVVKLVRAASSNPAPFSRRASRYGFLFSAVVFLFAGAIWYISGSALRFLEVIIVATPGPFLLAPPVACCSGMSRASKYGIIIKTGGAFQKLARLKALVFDKTGILTQGKPVVSNIIVFNKFSQAEVLSAAASLEQNSDHRLAKAIVEAAVYQKVGASKARHVSEIPGYGLSAHNKGKDILAGRLDFIQDNNVEVPSKAKLVKDTAVWVAIDGKLAGIISFSDEVRPEANTTIQRLRHLGIKRSLVVSGDNVAATQKVAKALGIKDTAASALPANKLSVIEETKERPVGFVGNGVDDAAALTAADVGIALGVWGTTAASDSAGVIILPDNLAEVGRAVQLAKQSFTIAKQSIAIGIIISLLLIGVFATGKFPAVLGAALQVAATVLAVFSALRAHTISAD